MTTLKDLPVVLSLLYGVLLLWILAVHRLSLPLILLFLLSYPLVSCSPPPGFLLLPAVTLPRRSFVLLLFLLLRALTPPLLRTAGLLRYLLLTAGSLPPKELLLTTELLLSLTTFLTTVTLPLFFVPSLF